MIQLPDILAVLYHLNALVLATPVSLRHVDLSHNDFRRLRASDLVPLHAGAGRPSIEYLSLADCGLVQIDAGAFEGLDNLTSLTLSRCLVNETVLARAFAAASFRGRLLRLDISETYIANLSIELVGSFGSLIGLFASYCDLANVDPNLFQHIPFPGNFRRGRQ